MNNKEFDELISRHDNLSITFTQDGCFGCVITKELFKNDIAFEDIHHLFIDFDPKGDIEKMMSINTLPTTVIVVDKNPINTLIGPVSPETILAQIKVGKKVIKKIKEMNK